MSVPSLKVLDLSTHFSGSVASAHLASLGADVLKVENPAFGDGNRGTPPLIHGEAMAHLALNMGKRSIAIDRRSEQWGPALMEMVGWADIVILGSQPMVAKKRGLDFDSLVAMNSGLVYCNISGFGQTGPWRDTPLHGLNADVLAGLVPLQKVGGYFSPAPTYRSVGTTLAGIHAVIGVLEAIRRRDAGMGAQQVYASVWESAMYWQWRDMTTQANIGEPNPAYADLGSRYASYETNDGRVMLICPVEKRFWLAFCDLLGLPPEWKLRGDWTKSGMDWGKGYDDEPPVIADALLKKTLEEWIDEFERADIPFSPYLTIEEAMETPQAKAVGVVARTTVKGLEVTVPNIPIHIADRTQSEPSFRGPSTVKPPPELGEHNAEFLKEILE